MSGRDIPLSQNLFSGAQKDNYFKHHFLKLTVQRGKICWVLAGLSSFYKGRPMAVLLIFFKHLLLVYV